MSKLGSDKKNLETLRSPDFFQVSFNRRKTGANPVLFLVSADFSVFSTRVILYLRCKSLHFCVNFVLRSVALKRPIG